MRDLLSLAGIDFLDTFSPVAKLTTVRVLLSLAAQSDWHLLQLDINNAFLYGELVEESMQLPLGYPTKGENLVCKLNKFSSTILAHGFKQSLADNSLFTKSAGSNLLILLVYVDDIIIAGPNSTAIQHTRALLETNFKLKNIGDQKYFLDLEIAKSEQGVHLCQRKYTFQLLTDTRFLSAKPLSLPMNPNIQLNDTDGEPL